MYIVQLCPFLVFDQATHIRPNDVATAALHINLRVDDVIYVGTLSGYISRVNAYEHEYSGVNEGHYVSVTKCKVTGNYFITDDLDEEDAKNIGETPTALWPKPYLLFYTVNRQNTKRHSEVQLERECVSVINVEIGDIGVDSERNTYSTTEVKDNTLQVQSVVKTNMEAHADVADQIKGKPQTFIPPRTRKVLDLPLLPPLTIETKMLADTLRNREDVPNRRRSDDTWQDQTEQYDGAKIYKVMETEGYVEVLHELLECNYTAKGINPASKGISQRVCPVTYLDLQGLRDQQFVNGNIINAFINYFHQNECMKKETDPSYLPTHVMNTFFIEKLCFASGARLDNPNVKGMNKWMLRKRVSKLEYESKKSRLKMYQGSLDIFQCERVMFPMNEDNNHWIIWSINPKTLKMIMFDSLHGKLTSKRCDVASCIAQWVVHEHYVRHGRMHVKADYEWSPIHDMDDGRDVMESSKQGPNDCAIHVCAIPVLLSNNIPLKTLGINRWDWTKAGVELRQRICLTFETGEFYFKKRIEEEATGVECTKTVHVESRSSDESLNDVLRVVTKSVNENKRRAKQAVVTKNYKTKYLKKEKPSQ